MTTTNVSDAIVLPQSKGTGLSSEDAPVDAAVMGLLARYTGGEYVDTKYDSGLAFQNHNASGDTVEVGPGAAFVKDTGTSTSGQRSGSGNPQSESTSSSGYNTELPTGQVYIVLFPTATQISVSDSVLNAVHIDIDVTGNNSVNLEHGGSTAASPGNVSLKIGETNPDDATADTRANDDGSLTLSQLNTADIANAAADEVMKAQGDGTLSFGSTSSGGSTNVFFWGLPSLNGLSTGRRQAVGVSADGLFYVYGGEDVNFNKVSSIEEYDPGNGTWTTKASSSTARSQHAGAGLNSKAYYVGGQDSNGQIATFEFFNPLSGGWDSSITDMPSPRYNLAAAAADGKIYAIGGQDSGNTQLARLEEYDPGTDSWDSTVTDMPTAHRYPAATGINNKVYVFGGSDVNGNTSSDLFRYDPSTDSWTTLTNAPTARSLHAVGSVNGKLYAMAGSDANGNNPTTPERYDPGSDSWTQLTSTRSSRRQQVAGGDLNGELYLVGGFDNNASGNVGTLEKYIKTDS